MTAGEDDTMTENKSINRILICSIAGMYALWGCLHLYNHIVAGHYSGTTSCVGTDESAELLVSQSDNAAESSEFAVSQGDITKYEDYRAHYTGTVFVPAHTSQIPMTGMTETIEIPELEPAETTEIPVTETAEMPETTESLAPKMPESSENLESPTLVMSATTESPVIAEPEITESPVVVAESAPTTNDSVYADVLAMTTKGAGVTDAHMQTIALYYGMMPQVIRDYIKANNMIICVDAYGTYTDGHAGLCYMNNGVVPSVINLNCQKSGQLEMSVIHEFGHAIDNLVGIYYGYSYDRDKGLYYNCLSNCDEFQALYYEECPTSGYGPWAIYASWEYFAESFRFYFEDRSKVPPKTCAFMSRILTEFFGTPL